jgi:hypothetical protein
MPSVLLSFVRGTIASQPVPPQASQQFFCYLLKSKVCDALLN